jgi:hypothetical protein
MFRYDWVHVGAQAVGSTGMGISGFRGGYDISYDPGFYNILLNISTSAPMALLTWKESDDRDPVEDLINGLDFGDRLALGLLAIGRGSK